MRVLQCINITAVFLLCQQSFVESTVEECSGNAEYSILGMMLRRHIFKKVTGAPLGNVCLRECYRDVRCQSFNYVISQSTCELSNRTKEARPEDFVPSSDRYYFKRDMNRVRLGTISEMPADSCQEIKASEGEYAVDGKYWLNFHETEKQVLAYCDMKTGDIDECSASVQVCDANAICQNAIGSYLCSCKAGYSGDGKTCTDIDECSASVQVCDANAICQNTIGSYLCSCIAGYSGDGKTCTDIDECSASVQVCDVNVICQNTLGSYLCSCKAGYSGDGKTCTDIDECSASVRVCDANASCQNTLGSYLCSCKAGYSGDGKTCTDIDECSASVRVCDVNAICQNTLGSYLCSCIAGYSGDGKTCTDIDECSASVRVCDANAICQSTVGSYLCSCKAGYNGDGKTCTAVNKDCAELYKSGKRNSGEYAINPDGLGAFNVFCDQRTDGGGWTVFQKRMDGSVDFYHVWTDYKRGFGYLRGEFWLGLDKIHRLTSSGGYKLRVDLEDFAGNTVYAEYGLFAVGSEGTKYQLSVGSYSGTAGDSLAYHNGYPFSTKDQDNDSYHGNCAVAGKGAWWYNNCHFSNLNGIYYHGHYRGASDSLRWIQWKSDSAKRAEMKIRPVNY